MPQHVRNFWLEGWIDGRTSPVTGGPQSKDGGFSLTVYQRSHGTVAVGLRLRGWVDPDTQSLTVEAETEDGNRCIRSQTTR